MPAKKPKVYRVYFLITRPAGKFEKVTGVSHTLFITANNEEDIKEYVNKCLSDIRKENGDNQDIYIKSLKIKHERCSGIVNLIKK